MGKIENITRSLHRHLRGGTALKDSFSAAAAFFHLNNQGEATGELFRRSVLPVVKVIISDNGEINARKLSVFRHILESDRSESETAKLLAELKIAPYGDAASLAEALNDLPESGRFEIFGFLLKLSVAVDAPAETMQMMADLAGMLGISPGQFDELRERECSEERHRRRIISSGAGIAVALIVIVVFILTATFLRSVVFGLIVAYLLLPLEQYFELRLREKRGFGYHCFRILSLPLRPFYWLSRKVMRHGDSPPAESSEREAERKRDQSLIAKATAQTVALVLLLLLAIIMVLSSFTGQYVKNIGATIRRSSEAAISAVESAENQLKRDQLSSAAPVTGTAAVQSVPTPDDGSADSDDADSTALAQDEPPAGASEKFILEAEEYLDHLRERFEKIPLVQLGIDRVGALLRDENARRELFTMLLKRTGGVFSFTASVIGTLVALATDLLLTIFFALLFLMKIAEFCRTDKSAGRRSEYLVRTVFNGNWLPGATDEAISEARRIIGGIFDRLRVWIKGYLTLVLIDSTVYSTLFYLLDVPYFLLLGIFAGCGILLPYIGPVLSASVTILTTLAVGHSSGAQLAGILLCYIVYNGIIEQFILYPAVIGESLGLTTLETIIVVLLGAIFAGIFGMIFALPAASVIKYIVPQIYRQLENYRK